MLAAALINGRTYQGDEPYLLVTKIVFHDGNGLDKEEDRIVVTNDGSDWAAAL
jgi:hypothetical protein